MIRQDNTFIKEKVSSPGRRVELEVGDSKQAEFIPQFKTKHWDNEANFSVRFIDDLTGTVETDKDVIKYVKPDLEVKFYEQAGDEDGQFEFEVLLKEKPVSNVLEFSIQSKELNFLYQPALTQDEIDSGATRPENVIGSYAVYHKSKRDNIVGGKEYRTGKALHIYRPELIGADGQRVWAELYIDEVNGIMRITCPQEFIDNAVYPVIVDPTFGYTSTPASDAAAEAGVIKSSLDTYSPASNGTLTSMSIYTKTSSGSANVKGVIYAGTALVDYTNSIAINTTPEWKNGNVVVGDSVASATSYRVGHKFDSTLARIYFDSGASGNFQTCTDAYANAFPDPITWSNAFSALIFGIYATYTADPTSRKTILGLPVASVKTVNGLAIASVKTFNGLT